MVRKGSEIKSIQNLKKDGVVFVNRQKGSGTRILFDYLLQKYGISRDEIDGYSREMNTHMMIASAVKSGSADAGMGVLSAALTAGLEFYPVGDEEYDFLIRKDMIGSPQINAFIECLQSAAFKEELNARGGYNCDDTGNMIEVSTR